MGGSYTGYDLSAAEFNIGGATETSSGSGVWQGGNVDGSISQVEFRDAGVAGDPANTVNVAITMPQFTVPQIPTVYYIDIDDEIGSKKRTANRSLCARVHHPKYTNQTVTYATMSPHGSTVTRTQQNAGSSTKPVEQLFQSSDLADLIMSQVVQITFTAGSGYYFDGATSMLSSSNLSQVGFEYTPYYRGLKTQEVFDAQGRLTSFVFLLEYTPPANAPLNPDPTHLCKLRHQFNINYTLVSVPVTPSNQIVSVNYSPTAPSTSSSVPITVSGTVGGQYTLQVTEQQGLTNNSIATSNGYYNFTDNVFQTNSINSGTQTITAEGINIHNITLPNNTSGKKRFDIIVAGAGSPATSLASSVPDAHGEASIIQEGISTLTITTQTYAGGFGGMVNTAVTRPTNVTKEPTTITTTGGTAGVTTTLITLDTNTTGIQTGMVITGTGVSHGTTVVAFEDDRFVTASQNATITDGTTLNFS